MFDYCPNARQNPRDSGSVLTCVIEALNNHCYIGDVTEVSIHRHMLNRFEDIDFQETVYTHDYLVTVHFSVLAPNDKTVGEGHALIKGHEISCESFQDSLTVNSCVERLSLTSQNITFSKKSAEGTDAGNKKILKAISDALSDDEGTIITVV